MKLIKFRIQNYKSIKDSGWCDLDSDLIVLAGKNESGKTSILEALRDFNTNVENLEDAQPIDNNDDKPKITMCFEVKKPLLDAIAKEGDLKITREVRGYISKNPVTISKFHDGEYCMNEELNTLLNKEELKEQKDETQKLSNILKSLDFYEELEIPSLQGITTSEELKECISKIRGKLEEYSFNEKDTIIKKLETITNALQIDSISSKFLQKLKEKIPNFILFTSFSDLLPYEVPFSEIKNHKAIKYFETIANLDLEKIGQESDSQKRSIQLAKAAAKITGNFHDYYKQNKIDLSVVPNGEKICFWVKDSNSTTLFKIEQRSKGFQWFLSFYLCLNAECSDNETSVILIDEPDLHLHAKAQQDVLKVLTDLSKKSQVIFGTHSPYLIDAERLDRVRLVEKRVRLVEKDEEEEGTKINGIHKNAGAETLTPIITAIGLDLSQSLSFEKSKKHVLLEGISDYYYMEAFREHLNLKVDLSFIPCIGASKIPNLVSLLIGWGFDYAVVLDNDKAGKTVEKKLKTGMIIEKRKIIFVGEENDNIEALFSKNDREQHDIESDKSNKALIAKELHEKALKNSLSVSNETKSAFKKLFEKIEDAFQEKNSSN